MAIFIMAIPDNRLGKAILAVTEAQDSKQAFEQYPNAVIAINYHQIEEMVLEHTQQKEQKEMDRKNED